MNLCRRNMNGTLLLKDSGCPWKSLCHRETYGSHTASIYKSMWYRVNNPCLKAAAMGTSKLLGVTALGLALSLCVNVYERVCVC